MFRGFRPNERFGDFQLLRRLGHGGMGEVWLARPRFEGELPERVVLKLIFEHLADSREMLDRFLDEARLAEHLKHPNVVRVWGHGEARGAPYMAMEFIDGLNLASCLQAHGGPLLPSVAARWVADACTGLAYAHELAGRDGKPLRIVHRDLSPDNLMVDVEAHVRLVDFGIARATTNDVTTQAGSRKGKLRYMAPEYFHDQIADQRTDVYSMGLTLWHLVTGTKPFGEGVPDHVVMARRFLSQGVERADVVRPSVPRSLVDVIARAVAPEASQRTPTARELRRELLDFLREYPPPSRTELAAELALWKQRLGEDHIRPKLRPPGASASWSRPRSSSRTSPPSAGGARREGQRWARAWPWPTRSTSPGSSCSRPGRSRRALRRATMARPTRCRRTMPHPRWCWPQTSSSSPGGSSPPASARPGENDAEQTRLVTPGRAGRRLAAGGSCWLGFSPPFCPASFGRPDAMIMPLLDPRRAWPRPRRWRQPRSTRRWGPDLRA